MGKFFKGLFKDSYFVSVSLLKVLIPVIIVVKLFIELGGVKYIAIVLGPLMTALGLPPEFALVYATTLLTNLTGGILVLMELLRTQSFTVEQITVLSILMLFAHSLPVEGRVAQKVGLRLRVTLVLRIGGGFVLAWLLHLFYSKYGLLNQPFTISWQPGTVNEGLLGWITSQIKSLTIVISFIIALLFLLRILKLIGVEKLMVSILTPLLRLLGIGEQAATLSIVGITLGISYGGGLLLNEVKKGHLSRQDVFATMSMLSLCHSMIDDTILMLLLGADVNAIIWARLVFSITVIAILVRFVRVLPFAIWDSYLVRWNKGYKATRTA
jgi:hypothetical protein